MMQPRISIIVPIYNVEKYIRKSMDSILNQTLREIEVILINDGSTDLSGEIADEYAAMDRRVKVIHQENKGVSVARNNGIDIAKGTYIGFVDPDDWINSWMYEELEKIAQRTNSDVVGCGHMVETEGKCEVKIEHYENDVLLDSEGIKNQILLLLLKDNIMTYCFDKIYRTTLIKKNHIKFPKNVVYREDTYFFMDVFTHAKSFIYISKPLYHYRRITGSASTKKYNNYLSMNIDLHRKKFESMEKWGGNSDLEKKIGLKKFIKDILWYLQVKIGTEKNKKCTEKYSEIKDLIENVQVTKYISKKYISRYDLVNFTDGMNEKVILLLLKWRRKWMLFMWIIIFYYAIYPTLLTIRSILPNKVLALFRGLKT